MKFKKQVLKNGLRLIAVPNKENPAVTVLVIVEAGTQYETKDINGISHFLEHLCFKGTAKRPSALHITEELDSIGAEYNAFTSHEFTGYYAKSHPKHLERIIDVVSDMYLHPAFPPGEIEKERGVILEEINMYEDLPQRKVGSEFLKLLYGDQPAGWTILGQKEVIRSLTQEDFVSYKKKFYTPESTIVVVSGSFDEKEIVKKIGDAFAPMKSGARKYSKKKVVEAQKKPELIVVPKKTDQSHIVVGVRTFSASHKDTIILRVLTGILSGGMSSRLFQKIRDEMGAAYYVRALSDLYTDHGYFAIASGVDSLRYEQVLQAILDECRRLTYELVTSRELKKVKEHLIGTMFLGLETSDAGAEFYAEQEILTGNLFNPKELARLIQAVSAEEIQRVAKKIFVNSRLNFAGIGPTLNAKKIEKMLYF